MTSLRKQLHHAVVFTSDSETSTEEAGSSEPESSDDTTSVVSSVSSYDLTQLLSEQSNLYHSHNAQKWKVLPKTTKLSNITPEEMRKFLWDN
jgi:hypothetical protein